MNGKELREWRKMVELSQNDAATVLGYGRRTYQLMERGMVEIRDGVGLACAAFALGIRSYDGPSIAAQIERERKAKKKGKR